MGLAARIWAAHGLLGVAVALQSQPPAGEGDLRNSSLLPTREPAADWFGRGDADFARLIARRAQGTAEADLDWLPVWEAWRSAVVESATGDAIPLRPISPETRDAGLVSPIPDPDGSAERRSIGVEDALFLRLEQLTVDERQRWAERFEDLAHIELDTAGREVLALAQVERRYPGTRAAIQATLRLFELAYEEGRMELARAWVRRGKRQLELLTYADLARALDQRAGEIGPLEVTVLPEQAGEPGVGETWATASALEPRAAIAMPDSDRLAPYRGLARNHPGQGVLPGVVFPSQDLAIAQLPGGLVWLDLEAAAPVATLALDELLKNRGYEAAPILAAHEPPGWPLRPATDGRILVLVHGRSLGHASNVLVCLESIAGGEAAQVRWVAGDRHVRRGTSRRTQWPEGWGPPADTLEYQPGPLIIGSQVLAQVRTVGVGDGPESSWLVAFDAGTGDPRWSRRLVDGVALTRDLGRFARNRAEWMPAQALVEHGGLVFAGTHLGAGALLDAADGRWRWGLRNRRREANATTWAGWWPYFSLDGTTLLWSPADSDFLYRLRSTQRARDGALFASAPRSIREGLAVIGGDAGGALVLSRAGARQTVSRWGAEGARTDALDLAPEEHFAGPAAVSRARVLCSSERGVYLLDRTRDLWLLDADTIEPLASGRRAGPAGGGVYARGKHVVVAGLQGFWLFEAH